MKKLQVHLLKKSGRNGKILARTKGGGHKRRYRFIDYKRFLIDLPAIVKRIEYDPNRTANIALICYLNGLCSYIIAPYGLKVGMLISNGQSNDLHIGNALYLRDIPVGSLVHNIEARPGSGGKFMRAAGCAGIVSLKDLKQGTAVIKLRSGVDYEVSLACMATIGTVSCIDHGFRNLKKAGRNRWFGRKPVVRGVARNPVDHPNGGRTCGGKVFKTPWGQIAKGRKTVYGVKQINKFIMCNL